jgi:hypothetical protein
VNFFTGKTNVFCCRGKVVLIWNDFRPSCLLADFAALLRRIVFIGEAAIGSRFDLKGIGLQLTDLPECLVEFVSRHETADRKQPTLRLV